MASAAATATGSGAKIMLDLRQLRAAGALMLGAALVRGWIPGEPGVACPLRSLTGIPCPLCGMTTSVTDAVHLRWPDAAAANPAGLVAVMTAGALLAVRRPSPIPLPRWVPGVAVTALWAYQLWRVGIA